MSIYSSVMCVSVCVFGEVCERECVSECVCVSNPSIHLSPPFPPSSTDKLCGCGWAGPSRAEVEGSLARWWVWLTSQLAALNRGYDRLIRRLPHHESKAAGKTAIPSTQSNWATDGGDNATAHEPSFKSARLFRWLWSRLLKFIISS